MKPFEYASLRQHIAAQSHSYLINHGFTDQSAQALLQEAAALPMEQEAQANFYARHFTKPDGSIDLEKQRAFARVHTIERTVGTYQPILERRAFAVANNPARDKIVASVQALKAAGLSADEAGEFFNRHVKDARAMTPHPTEGLSPEGVKLSLELVSAAESDNPNDALKGVVDKMFAADTFASVKKATILEEIDQDTLYSKIHLQGVNQLNRMIEDAIKETYGTHIPISTNTAPRTWAYDADGKPNADGFAMLAKMATTTMESFRLTQDLLRQALADESLPAAARGRLERLSGKIQTLQDHLQPVYDQSRHVVQKLADAEPAARGKIYDDFYHGRTDGVKSFKDLAADFSKLYKAVGSRNAGLDFYSATLETLGKASNSVPHSAPIDEAYRTIQSMGFVLEKGQTRHNDLVYKDIINRFFHKAVTETHGTEWILETMTAQELENLRAHPNKPWDKCIKPKRQAEIWESLIEAINDTHHGRARRQQLVEALYAANPLEYRSDGYPEQTHTLLDRLALRSAFPLKFEEGIISDSQNLAPFRQRFLAEAFNMPAMKHMPLFEDLLNFGISQTLMNRFARHGGTQAAARKADILTKMGVGTGYDGLHVIVPASDSGKEGGPGARLKALRQYRKLVRKALENNTPIQIMLGGGLSLGRFGGDVGVVRRIVAQEMKHYAIAHNHDFDLKNPRDARLLRMMSAVLYTEQGRANRLLSATPGQVCDTIAGRITESVQDRLDLTGAVEDYTFIDEAHDLKPRQEKLVGELADLTLSTFNRLRHARNEKGQRVLDLLADRVRPAALMPFANNGARPASKSGSKGITEERAIGNDQSLYAAELFHGGFYGLGRTMAGFKQEGRAEDLAAILLDNPDVEYANIVSGLTDAMRFDANALFAKTSLGKSWTFERVLKAGKKTDIVDGELICHKDGVELEEAYLAKIWYDRLLFLAILEGAANGTLADKTLEELIETVRPKDGGLDVQPGPATLQRWPLPQGIVAKHAQNAAGFALMNGANQALLNGQTMPEADKRSLMGAWRAGTAPHDEFWAANATCGYSPFVKNRRRAKGWSPNPALKAGLAEDGNNLAHPECSGA